MLRICLILLQLCLVLNVFFTTSAGARSPLKCHPTRWEELRQKQEGNGEKKLVFFASWCSSCIKHMHENQGPKTVYVAVFDEQVRAEKAINMLGFDAPCYTSLDIAEVFDVKALPSIKIVRF